jgi:hypothetical protein
VQKQYNNQMRLRREKALLAVALPAPKAQLEVENSGAPNFVTSFKVGRENYEKMATARRDLAVTWA